jgi:copper chaperone
MTEQTFEIEGMSCEHCVRAVQTALQALPGVREVQVQVGRAVVRAEQRLSVDAVALALDEEGYRVKL